ncbi:MAG: hypothetical protein SPI84_04310 [Anaerovoracaceae bacterium]|nr:hypothetical protein [Anaerovoracaceae bacterium]
MMKKIPMKILCITVLTVCLAAVPGFAYADDFVIDDPGSISVTLPEDETSEQDSPQNPEEPAQNPEDTENIDDENLPVIGDWTNTGIKPEKDPAPEPEPEPEPSKPIQSQQYSGGNTGGYTSPSEPSSDKPAEESSGNNEKPEPAPDPVVIDDEDTPLSDIDIDDEDNGFPWYVIVIAAAAVLLCACLAVVKKKYDERKNYE